MKFTVFHEDVINLRVLVRGLELFYLYRVYHSSTKLVSSLRGPQYQRKQTPGSEWGKLYTGSGCILAAFTLVGEKTFHARPDEGSCEGCDWDPICCRIRFRNLEWFVGLYWQTLQPQQGRSGEAPTRLFPTIFYSPSAIVTPFWKEYLFIRLSKRILLWSLLKLTHILSANFRKFGIKKLPLMLSFKVTWWQRQMFECSTRSAWPFVCAHIVHMIYMNSSHLFLYLLWY